jgi:hypothetical protein
MQFDDTHNYNNEEGEEKLHCWWGGGLLWTMFSCDNGACDDWIVNF